MKAAFSLVFALSLTLACLAQNPQPALFATASLDFPDLKDAARGNREVPLKIRYPKNAKGPFPAVIFSHGLGGSRDGYSYLGEFWASRGIVCVHVQHKGSDGELLKDGPLRAMASLTKAMSDPENLVNRPLDVSFAINELTKLNASNPELKGLIDMNEIGVGGHSFGAYTTLAVAGQSFPGGRSFLDKRVKAALEMSAPGRTRQNEPAKAYGSIAIPMMHLSGTADKMPGGPNPEDRLLPFKNISAPRQYLIVFDGGDHMLFSGRNERGDAKELEKRHALIQKATCAFWLAYLKGDKAARDYLDSPEGLKADLAAEAAFDRK